jgi:hypothetical protein
MFTAGIYFLIGLCFLSWEDTTRNGDRHSLLKSFGSSPLQHVNDSSSVLRTSQMSPSLCSGRSVIVCL